MLNFVIYSLNCVEYDLAGYSIYDVFCLIAYFGKIDRPILTNTGVDTISQGNR